MTARYLNGVSIGGILNAHLLRAPGESGHTDLRMLSGAAMPLPDDKACVDLAIINDLPMQLTVPEYVLER